MNSTIGFDRRDEPKLKKSFRQLIASYCEPMVEKEIGGSSDAVELGALDTSLQKKNMGPARLLLERLVAASAILASIIIVCRLLHLILTTGNNCLTNDYQYLVPIVDSLLSRSIDWKMVIDECFQNSHFLLLPVLGFCGNAAFFEWNSKIDCCVGVLLAVLRALLFFDCLSMGLKGISRWVVFLSIFALTFGSTALSCFTFGQASLTGGIGMLAFALGLWGVTKHSGTLRGDILMFVGGVAVSLCAGYWVPSWIALACARWLCGNRGLKGWMLLGVGVLLSALPALLHIGVKAADAPKLVAVFNLPFLVNALGRCFANRIGVTTEPLMLSEVSGWLSIVSMIAFLAIAPVRRADSRYAAALAISLFGLLSLSLTSLFRVSVAPWYAGYAVFVWIGILAVACLGAASEFDSARTDAKVMTVWRVASQLLIFVSCILYLLSNLKMRDKDFWAETRSEASESCVRNYQFAPTYCEKTLFLGHIGDFPRFYKLAAVLRRRHWSACSKRQKHSLQGDFILPTVTVIDPSQSARVCWIQGVKTMANKSWNDPEHLNLLVSPAASVRWRLAVPIGATSAAFKTRVLNSEASSAIWLRANGAVVPVLMRNGSVSFDLLAYKGKEIEIRFETLNPQMSVVFEHPIVEVALEGEPESDVATAPSNTDLSEYFPTKSKDDLVLPLDGRSWKVAEMHEVGLTDGDVKVFRTDGTQPKITYIPQLSVSPRKYGQLAFTIRASEHIKVPRAACVGFTVNNSKFVQRLIPLLPDPGFHGYSYDLKLLELEPADRITGLEILPVYVRGKGDVFDVALGGIRFAPLVGGD